MLSQLVWDDCPAQTATNDKSRHISEPAFMSATLSSGRPGQTIRVSTRTQIWPIIACKAMLQALQDIMPVPLPATLVQFVLAVLYWPEATAVAAGEEGS